jgi:hypothetical protein
MTTKIEELEKDLKNKLRYIHEEEMNDCSWGQEEGVIISGNQAKFILDLINKRQETLAEVVDKMAILNNFSTSRRVS